MLLGSPSSPSVSPSVSRLGPLPSAFVMGYPSPRVFFSFIGWVEKAKSMKNT
jgi:hypothetical protein